MMLVTVGVLSTDMCNRRGSEHSDRHPCQSKFPVVDISPVPLLMPIYRLTHIFNQVIHGILHCLSVYLDLSWCLLHWSMVPGRYLSMHYQHYYIIM